MVYAIKARPTGKIRALPITVFKPGALCIGLARDRKNAMFWLGREKAEEVKNTLLGLKEKGRNVFSKVEVVEYPIKNEFLKFPVCQVLLQKSGRRTSFAYDLKKAGWPLEDRIYSNVWLPVHLSYRSFGDKVKVDVFPSLNYPPTPQVAFVDTEKAELVDSRLTVPTVWDAEVADFAQVANGGLFVPKPY